MKLSKGFSVVVLAMVLFTAAGAFAAGKGSLSLTQSTIVGSEQLPAGEYRIKWDEAGPAVQLQVLRGNKVVATVPAEIVQHDSAEANSAAVVNENGAGRELSEIRFSGKKYTLAVGSPSAQKSSGAAKREGGN